MEVRGRIHKIMPVVQVTDTFRKRELVLMYADNPMYPQYPAFEFAQDRVTLLDAFQPGDEVEVSFDLNGREHTNNAGETKYYTTLRGYMVKKIQLQAPQVTYASTNTTPATTVDANEPAKAVEGEDDLPF